ncbi:hypothetical protein ND748_04505 [Frankia sp. AiPs1]|uniref:hypothetical protein n=1 Tax=Frankia sp. AiPs1 TaxID=573493 RepID=UPI0020435487|nr:hypothetical protein [Frankia sp. AiPs1]MCM3920939.1 hypothetical protein [Frankia sp. AiPs1]
MADDDDDVLGVSIAVSTISAHCGVSAFGKLVHTITDDEAAVFGFDQEAKILEACTWLTEGRTPDQWFLHDPTTLESGRGGNAYAVNGWRPVTVTIINSPITPVIMDTKPVILDHSEWYNQVDHPASHTWDMGKPEDPASSSWDLSGGGAGATISRSLFGSTVLGTGSRIWRSIAVEDVVRIKGRVVGHSSLGAGRQWYTQWEDADDYYIPGYVDAPSVDYEVPAKSSATGYLWSNVITARFSVPYGFEINGHVALHDKSGFYERPASDVLWKAGLPSVLGVIHDYTVTFHSDAVIEVVPGPYDPQHQLGVPFPSGDSA